MKLLLFLFFVGCAVKCDESQNFVVQMPVEDTQRNEDFKIYWNVPTMQCRSKKIPFDNLHQFGIIQNRDDSFRGEEITILYDPGYFPALLRNKTSEELKYRNGGVPQEGDLDLHLKKFASEIHSSIPDRNFSGIGIIDFESWRPVFRQNFGEVLPYQSVSFDIERSRHWFWTERMIREEARLRFEKAARLFMQYTIWLARKMRPYAKWGYYGFPYCFNTTPNNMNEDCPIKVVHENNQIDWLWMNSTALYPSVYSDQSLTGNMLVRRIRGRVREAARVRRQNTPILPYFSFRYRDAGYFTETDLHTAFDSLTASEASGVIIWGSSSDVNTVAKCERLHEYIYTVFGPLVAKYVKSKKAYRPEHLFHSDEKIDEDDDFITENNTSTTHDELNYILDNVTALETINNTESTTRNILDVDTSTYYLSIKNGTTVNITTISPLLTEATNNVDLETTTVKKREVEITTNRNEDYINIIDRRETSTARPENTTKDEVQHDDNNDSKESSIVDLDFSSITATPDNMTLNTTVKQVTGWAAIFNTIVTIMNGSKEDNSTDFDPDSEFELVYDFETSTYLETDLLMNNISDFNLINSVSTENSETSTLYLTDDFETTTSDNLFEIIFSPIEVTTPRTDSSKNVFDNMELTTEYVTQDFYNDSSISPLIKSLITDKTTNVNIEDNIMSTTDRTEDLSKNLNLTTKDNIPQHYDNNERENKTGSLAVTSTTFTLKNWTPNFMINETNNTTEIKNEDSIDSIEIKTTNMDLTTTVALLSNYNDENLTTTDAITSTSSTSEPKSLTSNITETNENIENNYIKPNSTGMDKILDNVENTTKDSLDYENHNRVTNMTETIAEEDTPSKYITLLPESYSAETIKQVTGSAPPTSRFKYIFCVVIYFSVSSCLCDFYGQCE